MERGAHREVQSKAKLVLRQIAGFITPESTEESLARACVELLEEYGVRETWYYSVPAFVLLGSRTCLSISGRDYVPAQERVGMTNLVTIDLSPLLGGWWGDCARSFVIEEGCVVLNPSQREFSSGVAAQSVLHEHFATAVSPELTFAAVFEEMNRMISRLGFENLDFLGNVGHSIVKRRDDRIFFEKGNGAKLSEVSSFTFEPHIRQRGGKWGFKHENIYYFDERGTVCEL